MLQRCKLEPMGMKIDETGNVKIEATPQHQAYYTVSTSKKRNLLEFLLYNPISMQN